jgi:hypothetical protein
MRIEQEEAEVTVVGDFTIRFKELTSPPLMDLFG